MKKIFAILIILTASLTSFGQWINWQKTPVDNPIYATSGNGYMLMTNSKPATVILPVSPVDGDIIGFLDIAGTFPFNSLTIDPGNIPIDGNLGTQIFSAPHLSLTLVYTSSPYGWKTLSTSDVIVNGGGDGQMLYWDASTGNWTASDGWQLAYDAGAAKLNVHNIESIPVIDMVGNYNTLPPAWGNQFITLSTEYGDITALMNDGLQLVLHGGSAEGETVYIAHSVTAPMFYEGSTVFGVSPGYSHSDYTSVTLQDVSLSPLHIVGGVDVSGSITSKHAILNSDTIAIGSVDKLIAFDTNSIFIGSPVTGLKTDNSIYLGMSGSGITDTIDLSWSIAIGRDVAENPLSVTWQSILIGNAAGYNTAISYGVLMGYRTGRFCRGFSTDQSIHNIAIGSQAMENAHADYNIALGYMAGQNCNSKYSIFLGQKAGYYEDSSYRFIVKQDYINPAPLLYGDFLNGRLSINNDDVSTYNFNVAGTGHFSDALTLDSALIVSAPIWQINTGQSVFIGEQAGNADDLTNNNNTFVGYQSGKTSSSGTYNVALGYQSLFYNTTGGFNTAVGAQAMLENTTGINNTAIGEFSLNANTSGQDNTALGRNSLQANATGSNNVAIGKGASYSNSAGSNNTVLGYQAGFNNISGSGNVFIGYKTAYNETTSNKLYINNNTGTPLIYGEFDNSFLRILGTLEIAQQLQFTELQPAPDSATAPGIEGEIRFTTNYIFVCTAANTWKRVPISTW